MFISERSVTNSMSFVIAKLLRLGKFSNCIKIEPSNKTGILSKPLICIYSPGDKISALLYND